MRLATGAKAKRTPMSPTPNAQFPRNQPPAGAEELARRRDVGTAGDDTVAKKGSVLGEDLIQVAEEPPLAWLGGCDHCMTAAARVLAGVTIRRGVAAQRDAADLARPQMHPRIASLDAGLAGARARRFHLVNLQDVSTQVGHVAPSSVTLEARRLDGAALRGRWPLRLIAAQVFRPLDQLRPPRQQQSACRLWESLLMTCRCRSQAPSIDRDRPSSSPARSRPARRRRGYPRRRASASAPPDAGEDPIGRGPDAGRDALSEPPVGPTLARS